MNPAFSAARARAYADDAVATRRFDAGTFVVEGEGETVGEAKWTALRELERRRTGERSTRGAPTAA